MSICFLCYIYEHLTTRQLLYHTIIPPHTQTYTHTHIQVNADIRYYTPHEDDTLELTRVVTTHVGKNISTKAIESDAREDITLQYKFAEGSTSERAALLGKLG